MSHYRNYEAVASTGQVWLEGGSRVRDGKEVLPRGHHAVTLGRTSVSEGSCIFLLLILCDWVLEVSLEIIP